MRAFLLVLLFPFAVHAEQPIAAATAPWGFVHLFASECKADSVLKQLPAGARSVFKRAYVQHNDKPYQACWTEVSPEAVYLIDESGDQGPISKRAFTKPTSL